MLDWARKKKQFLSNKCISGTKEREERLFFSWSKKKSEDVQKELKTFKEIACAQEGIMVF